MAKRVQELSSRWGETAPKRPLRHLLGGRHCHLFGLSATQESALAAAIGTGEGAETRRGSRDELSDLGPIERRKRQEIQRRQVRRLVVALAPSIFSGF